MPYSTYAKNLKLAALPNTVYISLHDDDPSTTGANEISGGTPAYARQAIVIAAPSNGVRSWSGTITLDVASGTTVKYIGHWDAATSGNWLGNDPVARSVLFQAQGEYKLTAFDIDDNCTAS